MCRGELTQSASQQRPLRCRLEYRRCPFCHIAPYKIEELSLDPIIYMFHEMISEEGINKIKELALPHMAPSTVTATDGPGANTRNYRISKNAWLRYESHPVMLSMLRSLHDLTDLDMRFTEQLQVANYGLGGHYEPHFDFFVVSKPLDTSDAF